MLAEIIHRLDGRPYEQYAREEFFEPLAMHDSWMGMPRDVYESYADRIAVMHDTKRAPRAMGWDTQESCARCVPGGGGRGPAKDLARIYEMLLAGGRDYLSRQSVEAATACHRRGLFDDTFGATIDWSLGFMLDTKYAAGPEQPYGFGPHAGPRTFGHGGMQSSNAFCDPERGLVVAMIFNGMPGEAVGRARLRDVATAVYSDLGLD
jgi:CubicO group peptidase (beta-lactamase class C family)